MDASAGAFGRAYGAKRQRQAPVWACQRACGALTHRVGFNEDAKAWVHALFGAVESGQLPFSGSMGREGFRRLRAGRGEYLGKTAFRQFQAALAPPWVSGHCLAGFAAPGERWLQGSSSEVSEYLTKNHLPDRGERGFERPSPGFRGMRRLSATLVWKLLNR